MTKLPWRNILGALLLIVLGAGLFGGYLVVRQLYTDYQEYRVIRNWAAPKIMQEYRQQQQQQARPAPAPAPALAPAPVAAPAPPLPKPPK